MKTEVAKIQKLTMEQAVVISAYTGFLVCPFLKMHEEIEKRLGRPVFIHEMASEGFNKKLREVFKDDFVAMGPEESKGVYPYPEPQRDCLTGSSSNTSQDPSAYTYRLRTPGNDNR